MPLRGKRIVLVEDNEDLAAIIEIILTGGHAHVDRYNNVSSATNHDWTSADAAIIDWRLPHVSGATLVDWLSAHHPDVRRVVLTAAVDRLRDEHPDLDAAIVSKGPNADGQFPHTLLTALRDG